MFRIRLLVSHGCTLWNAEKKKAVIVASKDQGEVDSDYLLVPVNMLDHERPKMLIIEIQDHRDSFSVP